MSAAETQRVEENMRLVRWVFSKLSQNDFIRLHKDDLISEGNIGLIKAAKKYNSSFGSFSSFATACIRNEMLMYLRSLKKHRSVISLDVTIDENEKISLLDCLSDGGAGEDACEYSVLVSCLESFLGRQKKRHRLILELYANGRRQSEIAEMLGTRQTYISKVLRMLKTRFKSKYL